MICFLMALKSPQLARDWKQTSLLCEASIRSALNQTEGDIRVILICHEEPDWIRPDDKRLDIIKVDFPPPERNPNQTMKDKWRKLAHGMVRASELKPDFVMFMDADDLVSNRISSYAMTHPESNGWIIKKGYRYTFGSRWIENFDDYNCGTNAIVSVRLIEFPNDVSTENASKCSVLKWGHTVIEKELATAGTPLDILPFRGGVYTVGHGENDSTFFNKHKSLLRGYVTWLRRSVWKSLFKRRYLNTTLRNEFGIPERL